VPMLGVLMPAAAIFPVAMLPVLSGDVRMLLTR
jgi:hypothetical protein